MVLKIDYGTLKLQKVKSMTLQYDVTNFSILSPFLCKILVALLSL